MRVSFGTGYEMQAGHFRSRAFANKTVSCFLPGFHVDTSTGSDHLMPISGKEMEGPVGIGTTYLTLNPRSVDRFELGH